MDDEVNETLCVIHRSLTAMLGELIDKRWLLMSQIGVDNAKSIQKYTSSRNAISVAIDQIGAALNEKTPTTRT